MMGLAFWLARKRTTRRPWVVTDWRGDITMSGFRTEDAALVYAQLLNNLSLRAGNDGGYSPRHRDDEWPGKDGVWYR